MVFSQTSLVAILFVFQLSLAQQSEGKRRGAAISVVRQEAVPLPADAVAQASGTYRDARRGAVLQVTVEGSDVTVTGGRSGETWSATGTVDGNAINIDMSAAGESEFMDGSLVAGGIQWSDGRSWTKQTGGRGSAVAAKKKAGRGRASDIDAVPMSTDEFDQDNAGTDQSALDEQPEDDADSTKPGHLPRIAFIAFVVVALLVMGTDEGKVAFAALQDKVMLALGQAKVLAKVKDPKSLFSNPIVSEVTSVMEFSNPPRRPRDPARKPQPEVSSMIDAAFESESTLPEEPLPAESEGPEGPEGPETTPLADLASSGDDLLN